MSLSDAGSVASIIGLVISLTAAIGAWKAKLAVNELRKKFLFLNTAKDELNKLDSLLAEYSRIFQVNSDNPEIINLFSELRSTLKNLGDKIIDVELRNKIKRLNGEIEYTRIILRRIQIPWYKRLLHFNKVYKDFKTLYEECNEIYSDIQHILTDQKVLI